MSYGLGIDVGTTYTAAAIMRDGNVEAFALGTYQVAVPSVVFAAGGEFLFGAPAARRGATQPEGLAREFKRRLGDPVPLMLSGSPYHADRLTALMGKWAYDTVVEQIGEPPSRTVMTHPANWTEYQLGALGKALHDVGLGSAELVSEPAAAALDYAAAVTVEEGSLLLVYDLGGGTFDVALLRRRGGVFEHEIEPFGIERLGGIDFDEAVFHFAIAKVPAEHVEAARQSQEGLAALANLRRSCVEAKESLSSDAATDIPVMLPGHTSTVRITRGEFEEMIRPMVQQTIVGVSDTLRRANVEPAALSAALLVGGSSRIPLVPQMVAQELGLSVRIDAHPKLVVAKGAARRAGGPAARRVGLPQRVAVNIDHDQDEGPDRRWWVAAVVGALGVAGVGGWLLTRDEDQAQSGQTTTPIVEPRTTPEPTAATSTPTTGRAPPSTTPVATAGPVAFAVVDQCATDPVPFDVALVGTDLWVTSAQTGSLQRCDIAGEVSRSETFQLSAGQDPASQGGSEIVSTPEFLYLTQSAAGTVTRVSLADMSAEAIEVEQPPFGAAVIGETVWVGADVVDDAASPGRLIPINGTAVGTTIRAPYRLGWVRAIGNELWVTYIYDNKIGRVDPTTGPVAEFDLPDVPIDILSVGDELWVTLRDTGQVAVLDPSTGDILDFIDVGSRPHQLVEAFGSVWVSNTGDGTSPGTISRIDPDTRLEVQPPIEVGTGPIALAVGEDRLYVANYSGTSVSVLGTQD